MLEALQWHGIAEVEFRLDSRDGVPKLMEINPRFWGSLCVAMAAGVDFPYLLYRIAVDGDVNSVSSYRVGVKGRYLEQDILYLISSLVDAPINPGIQTTSVWREALDWLKFYEPGIFYDLLDARDPLPFFFSTGLLPRLLLGYFREDRRPWKPAREEE